MLEVGDLYCPRRISLMDFGGSYIMFTHYQVRQCELRVINIPYPLKYVSFP
ncbi:hypothetical protein SAMN02745123_02992 [Desulforamulus aeronauticus DSM 10349]|uniref:Uncharacterized protein n=1 Tax=Desulforamulus aeronauticus DSM 10349 TaxID=1121421 RepID=A0A1M6UZ49_9FIRM|nr:hypothetical protein SAMN02745123_02992 [Desulforamulus aeronauticus DSM 10349]